MPLRLERHLIEELVEQLRHHEPKSHAASFMLTASLTGIDDFNVFADDWPGPSHILMKHGRKETESDHAERAFFFCIRKDEKAFLKMLGQTDVFDFGVEHKLEDIPSEYIDCIQSFCTEQGLRLLSTYAYDYYVKSAGSDFSVETQKPPVDDSDEIAPIQDEHDMETIVKCHRSHISNMSKGEVEYTVQRYPSLCVKSKAEALIGWAFVQLYGGLGRLFVMPEHRGKGYATFLLQELDRLWRAEGYHQTYVRIGQELYDSIAFHERRGFVKTTDFSLRWCIIRR